MQFSFVILLIVSSFLSHLLSHHWFTLQSDRGRSVRHLPSARRRQLRPSLLFYCVPWKPYGVPWPGDVKCRRSQNLDNWPPISDGRDQRRGLVGQAAANTRPISFKQSFTNITVVRWNLANCLEHSTFSRKENNLLLISFSLRDFPQLRWKHFIFLNVCVWDMDEADVWGGW